MSQITLLLMLAGLAGAFGSPLEEYSLPTVTLNSATVTGISSGSMNKFLGIPFAQPPTGNLRFQLPQALPPYNSSFSATAYGPACPQQAIGSPLVSGLPAETLDYLANTIFNIVTLPSAEDCLTLNVVAPAEATPDSKLPVVAWIYGGGFEIGGTSQYDGSIIVEKAISLGVPAIYVSMNYRLNAFGFLASQEVKDAGVGNLGLQDQRLALYWVQKYIGAFGGDPTKVTIWGDSAGAISVALHMLTNGGNPGGLFRAAFMQSGSPIPVGDITNGQGYYDALVDETGCSSTSNTLQCLREVPYETLLAAVNQSPGIFSYQSLVLAWMPRVDGVFLTDNPQYLVQQGSVADVPFVTGDCDDEGTVFSFSTLNITTDAQLEEYLRTYWLPDAPLTTIQELMQYYPADITQGSPFDTGILNALTPQFKRIAAFQGDAVFEAPRRFFLQNRSGKQPMWTFVSKRLKAVPFLGSFHGSDILNVYGGHDMASYLVRFVSNLDPNGGTDLYWPEYTTADPNMLEFLDGLISQALTQDTYRVEAIAFLTNVSLAYPV
ncbi:alpha/beta-hydrolase [Paxillus ammoniavirescens]|nr:alpha/beta-hydrolase [Paxillus ammoniavirescens]